MKVSELIFDQNEIFPYSKELDDVLFRLEASGILPYSICYDSKYNLLYLPEKNNFSENQRNKLEGATLIFKKKFSKEIELM